MFPDRPDRRLASDDMPFAPAGGPGGAGPRRASGVAGYRQHWRVPVTVLVGSLIAVTAFFAWQAQRDRGPAPGPTQASGNDSMVAAVAGLKRNPGATPAGTSPSTIQLSTIPASPASSEPGTDLAAGPATSRATSRTTRPATSSTGDPTSTSTTSTGPVKPVFIGDVVTFDDWTGPGAGGITVTLQADANRDGKGEATKATTVSSPNGGTYHFDADPGCYVVVFSVPAGQNVLKGSATNPVCLASGEVNARVDLVISRPVNPPGSCTVLVGNNRSAGVQVTPGPGNAPSYAFYDSSGKFIRSTSSLGQPDWNSNFPRYIGWSVQRYGYDPGPVASVAAEDGKGGTSKPLGCGRRNV